jgi:hypothetical protein
VIEEAIMSVTSITSVPNPYQPDAGDDSPQSTFQTVRSDFQQLTHTLAAGSIDAAQQALSTLQRDLPNSAAATPIGQALSAVGEALQSGDVSAAQEAFAKLQQQVSAAGGHHHRHHHHHHGAPAAGNAAANTGSDPNAPSAAVGSLLNTSA